MFEASAAERERERESRAETIAAFYCRACQPRQYRRYRPDTVPTPLISLLEEVVARFASRLASMSRLII